MAAVNKNTVVIMHAVGPVIVEAWIDNPNGERDSAANGSPISEMSFDSGRRPMGWSAWARIRFVSSSSSCDSLVDWATGNGLVDVLYGAYNPSGRLPFTMGKRREDYGVDVVYNDPAAIPQLDYTEGLLIDYRYFDAKRIAPRYEFGYGLSYTTFEYGNLGVWVYGFGGGERSSSDPSSVLQF